MDILHPRESIRCQSAPRECCVLRRSVPFCVHAHARLHGHAYMFRPMPTPMSLSMFIQVDPTNATLATQRRGAGDSLAATPHAARAGAKYSRQPRLPALATAGHHMVDVAEARGARERNLGVRVALLREPGLQLQGRPARMPARFPPECHSLASRKRPGTPASLRPP